MFEIMVIQWQKSLSNNKTPLLNHEKLMIDILTQFISSFYSHKFIQSIITNCYVTNQLHWRRRRRKIPCRNIQCMVHIRNVIRTTWSWILLPDCILKKVVKFLINCHSLRSITLCFNWIPIKIIYTSQLFKLHLTNSLIITTQKVFIADKSSWNNFILTVNPL